MAHQTASRLGYLGIQVAARKTRPPSQQPGAWAGILAHTDGNEICVSTSQEKWDKAKSIMQSLQANLDKGGPLPFKLLEQHQGFLVHLQQIYPVIAPYLKGLQLTLDGWREGRDDDGWKIPGWHLSELPATSPNAPSTVLPVPRLSDDLSTLAALFEPATPP